MNNLRRFIATLLTVLLIASPFQLSVSQASAAINNNVAQSEAVSIKTNLENNQVTKVDKFTFDVWVRDANDQKVDTKYVTVTNNGKNVPINWNDDEKTSYTVNLDVGKNNIEIVVDHPNGKVRDSYTVHREEAQDGDVIGSVTFSMDAFTIGLGYIIEPVKVDLIKGERASELLVRTLEQYGYGYEKTGTLHSSFYLSAIVADESEIYKVKPSIPTILKEELEGNYNENGYVDDYLGEFDFNSLSGWMYAVNNVFPNVGYADYYLQDEDVIRTQFTIALGSDIGGGWGNNFFDLVNKDALTSQVAEINTYHRDEYLKDSRVKKAYNKSLEVLQKVNASQNEIDKALENLKNAEQDYLDLPIAEKVSKQIDTLPSEKAIKLSDEEKVSYVRKSYESLTKQQKDLVTNINKLKTLEKRLEALKKEAANVTTIINALPSESKISLEDKNKVKNARKVYENLTKDQQKLVTNIDKLTKLESRLVVLEKAEADKKAAKEVTAMIEDLPSETDLTLSDKSKLEDARKAYDSLTKDQQKLVSNLEKLTKLESRMKVLEKAVADKKAADKVIAAIAGLPSESKLTLSNKSKLEDARKAYDSLTKDQQKLVSNLEKLTKLESRMKVLEKAAADKKAADKVIATIDGLPSESKLTISNKSKLEDARKAYDSLTKDQEKLVSNLDKLTKLESRMKVLEKAAADQKAADKVIAAIAGLPSESKLTLSDKTKLEDTRKAYESLTKDQEKLVSNLDKLTKLESRLVQLEKEAVNNEASKKVSTKIDALPSESKLTLADRLKLEKVRQAYDDLTEEQQKLVTNLEQLTTLEVRLLVLEKEAELAAENQRLADEVTALIDALPNEAKLTLNDQEKLAEVRKSYEKLTKAQEKLVANVDKLTNLEARMEVLEKEAAEKEVNEAAAHDVKTLVKALPDEENLTLDDKEQVEKARHAYELLTNVQQKLVTNLSNLTTLEKRLEKLLEEAADQTASEEVASKVTKEITGLPSEDNIRLTDKSKVEKVRHAYEKLTDSQKKLVANLSKLEALENRLAVLEKDLAEHEENVQAAEKVSTLIEALPSVEQVQIEDLSKVEETRDAYLALSEAAQELVTNYLHVLMLEQKIMQLKEDAAYEEQKSLLKAEIAEVLKTDLRKVKNESARNLGRTVGVAEDVLRKGKQKTQLYTTLFSSRQQLFTTDQSQSIQALTDAHEQLKDAVRKVEYKDETDEETVVLSHLIFEVERLKTVSLTEVTEEKAEVIKEKISRTEVILEKEEVTQEEIEQIVEEVQEEIEEINIVLDEPSVDKSGLATIIEYANNLDISNKSSTLQEEFNTVLSEAVDVLENEEATREAVERALTNLQSSIEAIEKEPDTESDTESDEESDTESDEESDTESDEESDTESDEESDTESDEESDTESDEESDTESDEESDTESDEESDIESDEESDTESDDDADTKSDKVSTDKEASKSNEKTTTKENDGQTSSNSDIKGNEQLVKGQGTAEDSNLNQDSLPKTATPIYSLMFIGLILFVLGFSYFVFQHLVRRKTI